MPTPIESQGVTYQVPISGEKGWSGNLNPILAFLLGVADKLGITVSGVVLPAYGVASLSVAAGATITQTAGHMRVQSTGGAVVLNATTAIADGSADATIVQELTLEGTSDANSVEVPDDANTDLNGPMVLGEGATLTLRYNAARGLWVETGRNR